MSPVRVSWPLLNLNPSENMSLLSRNHTCNANVNYQICTLLPLAPSGLECVWGSARSPQ